MFLELPPLAETISVRHQKTSQGHAFVQVTYCDLQTFNLGKCNFTTQHKVRLITPVEKRVIAQYCHEEKMIVSDSETFEELVFDRAVLSGSEILLTPGTEFSVYLDEVSDKVLKVGLPKRLLDKITGKDGNSFLKQNIRK